MLAEPLIERVREESRTLMHKTTLPTAYAFIKNGARAYEEKLDKHEQKKRME